MLLLTFNIGDERYAIGAERVVEVVPLIELKRLPLAEAWVAGIFDYRGTPVPAIDLGSLFGEGPSRPQMSTRIVLVRFHTPADDAHVLGIIAERVTETIKRDRDAFVDPGIAVDGAPFLDGVCRDDQGLIQRIDAERLLPAAVAERLFRQAAAPETPKCTATEG